MHNGSQIADPSALGERERQCDAAMGITREERSSHSPRLVSQNLTSSEAAVAFARFFSPPRPWNARPRWPPRARRAGRDVALAHAVLTAPRWRVGALARSRTRIFPPFMSKRSKLHASTCENTRHVGLLLTMHVVTRLGAAQLFVITP